MISGGAAAKICALPVAALIIIAACSSQRSAEVDSETQKYVESAVIGDIFEIQSGKLAMTRASSPAVMRFARMMTIDTIKATEELAAAIKRSGMLIDVPTALDDRHQALLAQLEGKHGADFDAAYTLIQTDAQKEGYKLHRNYSLAGNVEPLRAVATGAVSVGEHYLMKVQRLSGVQMSSAYPLVNP